MSNELLASKVVVLEQDPSLRPIRGVPTANTAIVGIFEKGPIGVATLFTNPAESLRVHGSFITAGKGPEAVDGFFKNGGKNIYIVRTVHYTDITDPLTQTAIKATVTLKDTLAADTLQVDAFSEGTWGNSLTIDITAATSGDVLEFNLVVKEGGVVRETWSNLSMTDTLDNFAETLINAADGTGSRYIKVTDLDSASAPPADIPVVIAAAPLLTGDDGLTAIADTDFTGDAGGGTGFHALAQKTDIRILIVPDRQTVAVHQGAQDYMETTRNGIGIAIHDLPFSNTAAQTVTYVKTTASLFRRSEFGICYWPPVTIPNPNTTVYGSVKTNKNITVPNSGHIAGLMARVDGLEPGGVFKAPAGIDLGILRGVVGVENEEVFDVTKRDLLYPANINPITKIPNAPLHVDGSRMLKDNGRWPSVNERRGVIFIELSIQEGILFAKHANNDNRLRAQVERTVYLFLLNQWKNGAFAGDTPEDSFSVDADIPGEGLNNAAEQFAKRLNIDIGLAMVKPTDFVIIRVSPDQRRILEAAGLV